MKALGGNKTRERRLRVATRKISRLGSEKCIRRLLRVEKICGMSTVEYVEK